MLARRKNKSGKKPNSSKLNETTTVLGENHNYFFVRRIGCGTFGAVFEVRDIHGHKHALKKVIQDPHYMNRELDTLKKLNHPNCMKLIDQYMTREGDPKQMYLHIISDLFPTNLCDYLPESKKCSMDMIRIFGYQLFRGLDYLHSIGICHRDIKPSNILVDPETGHLRICDFGSAKPLKAGDIGKSYIATRSYRAPELLYDYRKYNFPVDVWAAGCVLGGLIKGSPVFSASSNLEMIRVIADAIGAPSGADLAEYESDLIGDVIEGNGIESAIGEEIDPCLKDLLEKIFVYSYKKRLTAAQCMKHPFFDRVRRKEAILDNGNLFQLM